MVLSYKEKVTKYFRIKYKSGATRIAEDHPSYETNVNSVKKLLKMIDETGDVGRKEGSGRLQSVRTEENIKLVIVHELTIDRRSVSLVIEQDLDLRTLRKR